MFDCIVKPCQSVDSTVVEMLFSLTVFTVALQVMSGACQGSGVGNASQSGQLDVSALLKNFQVRHKHCRL